MSLQWFSRNLHWHQLAIYPATATYGWSAELPEASKKPVKNAIMRPSGNAELTNRDAPSLATGVSSFQSSSRMSALISRGILRLRVVIRQVYYCQYNQG